MGLYVHLPFCLRKCRYCDFCSTPQHDDALRAHYVERLCDELTARASEVNGRTVDTVYFGGGTPTLLSPALFDRLLGVAHDRLSIAPDAEITVECNPATVDARALSSLRSLGINRLSIGAQSAVDSELRALGRVHSFDDTVRTVRDARRAGFDNVSLDVMYGIPDQTRESFRTTLDAILALEPEHVSAYSLIVEPGTPFFEQRDTLALPDEDTVCDMTADALSLLRGAGYRRYEISNFARDGHVSRHNLHYWQLDDYLGLGIAAHSLCTLDRPRPDGAIALRTQNGTDLAAYLSGADVREMEEELTLGALRDEYVMLRLRLADGIDKSAFAARFGQAFDGVYGEAAARFIAMGLLTDTPQRIAFTDAGFAVSNTVLSEILFHEIL